MALFDGFFNEIKLLVQEIKKEFMDESYGKDNVFFDSGYGVGQKPKPKPNYYDDGTKDSPFYDQVKREMEKKAVKPTSHTHTHPAQSGAVVEKVKPIVGSLGEVNDEGCSHRDVRFVAPPLPEVKADRNDKLKEYLIFSEVLGKPKCRRR